MNQTTTTQNPIRRIAFAALAATVVLALPLTGCKKSGGDSGAKGSVIQIQGSDTMVWHTRPRRTRA